MTASLHEANAMPSQDTITLAVAILSTLILIRLLLPDLLAVVGLGTLKNGFAGGPDDAYNDWPSRIDDDVYQEMLALGFDPVGTCWEQFPFTRRFESFVFARPGEKCFGVLYPNDQIMPRRGSFLTVFETGGVVFTKNYCGGVEVEESDFLATGAQTGSAGDLPPRPLAPAGSSWKPPVARDLRILLAEALARHRLNVKRLMAQGQQLPAVFDGHEFIATQQRYYLHPRLRRLRQSSRLSLLLIKLTVLAPLPVYFLCRWGAGDPLPWTILLLEGLVGWYLRFGCSSAKVHNIVRGFGRKRLQPAGERPATK
jgi:hypothetical protein